MQGDIMGQQLKNKNGQGFTPGNTLRTGHS
jgi:hypothetical protein